MAKTTQDKVWEKDVKMFIKALEMDYKHDKKQLEMLAARIENAKKMLSKSSK